LYEKWLWADRTNINHIADCFFLSEADRNAKQRITNDDTVSENDGNIRLIPWQDYTMYCVQAAEAFRSLDDI
jgi:hypothetical protein